MNQNVIEANNIGISFKEDGKRDDFKSILFRTLKGDWKKDPFWALSDISFSACEGEILGVIGSNGAGKTTLCRILGGLLKPDKGDIDINGDVSALLSLGAGFNDELSGRENVFLNGMMMGMTRKEVKKYFAEIHEFSGLGDFIDEPVKHYSKGMKARLGFSIAAMLEPETLVLDETLATGDMDFRKRSGAKIQELVDKARMVVIVTHDMDFVEQNCSRAIWIDGGVVRMDGDPKEVAEEYSSQVPEYKPVKKKARIDFVQTKLIESDKTIVDVKNLTVSFRSKGKIFKALDDVCFSVKQGEILGIIGSNGAGKTTLCRTLTGIYKPDNGSVTVNSEISALLQLGSGFNRQLTARDNIILNGLMLGRSRKEIKALQDEIIEFSGLEKHQYKTVKSFSSGMKSRLGFSIAQAVQPELFIIDEALSPGDAAFQKKASLTMQEMIKKAEAVIVVTHSMAFVEKVCTRAIWFENGKIVLDGIPSDVISPYSKS
ncbi:ABC transporter ATP-binding protein [Spirochaeta isovalerica]|uniref:Teichoic acid transport system ATP-binding protein n=1 Tax=Spirochaeta isovalerica TaxID=150 RepID=A0A841RCN2_9SPIO|nr:ATP-binding cassette domain-containing protein [Spirochaeta isovalerica]MBB6480750.1 teichoic acid transport system ATP-binding protein [Spirochaeta isovalerica]